MLFQDGYDLPILLRLYAGIAIFDTASVEQGTFRAESWYMFLQFWVSLFAVLSVSRKATQQGYRLVCLLLPIKNGGW